MPALTIWHHHHGERGQGKEGNDFGLALQAMHCIMQGNPYFETAALLTSQVAVMVGAVQTTAYGAGKGGWGREEGHWVVRKKSAVPESAGSKLF